MGTGSSKVTGWKRGYGSSCFGLPKVLDEEKNEEVIDRSKNAETKSCHDHQEPNSFANCNYSMSDRSQEVAPTKSDVSGTSSTEANRSLNTSDRPRSRFGILSEGIGFRLGRTASLGSTNADGMFSCKFPISHADGFSHAQGDSNDPPDTTSGSARQEIASVNPIPAQDLVDHSIGINNSEGRRPRRRNQEPVEGTARFSRTLSVGRLRDRVLRRTSILDDRFGATFAEYGSLGAYIRQGSGRRDLNGVANAMFVTNEEVRPASIDQHSILPRTTRSHHNNDPDTQFRESRGQETVEHRSAFLERRRIRSQVRALQRLGSRFENLSGHDRLCILSGQHRSGYCTCRTNGRSANSGDDTGTRASISRIVMLAEALFEVLDEIHQQAVVLSSRPSLSSSGSVPAPKEVVDCIPVKIFTKSQKQQNDDSTQCYICLLEYEDGDCMRILPCGHEFHRTCVDKWLKEIHRVCPLCRGDVCTSDASTIN